jgi:YVTN family beta-propeller protein
MPALILALFAALAFQQPAAPSPQAAAAAKVAAENAAKLDFEFYRTSVEPIFLTKRQGNVRCVSCHGGSASSQFRLQPLPENALAYTEEQSRQNFESVARLVVPGGSPLASRLLKHPLSRTAGGDPFHGGGQHWQSQNDPEWQILAAWVKGERPKPLPTRVRIIQTNAAGDNTHVIDPATNKVVGVINDIEIPHGITSAPDGSRIYISNEHLRSLDAVNATTLKVMKRIKLSGRPNNVAISKDGRKVYVGIAQAPGALDVIDTQTLTNVKTIPVKGSIHNVYVTPDGKFAVAGSIGQRTISIVDTATDEMVRSITLSAGIRPMTFDVNPDGSTRNIYVQLSNFHGFVVVDFATGKETHRIELQRAVQAIAEVAKPGDDELVRVEFLVDHGGVDHDVRMMALHQRHAVGRGDDADHPDRAGTGGLEQIDRGGGAPASGQHRVDHQHVAVLEIAGQLRIVA